MTGPIAGVLPRRTADAGEALLLLTIDGAAILETAEDWSDEGLLDTLGGVLGPALRATRRPIKVRPGRRARGRTWTGPPGAC